MVDDGLENASQALRALVEALEDCKRQALREGSIGRSAFFDSNGSKVEGNPSELLIKALGDWSVMGEAKTGSVPRYPAILEADPHLIDTLQALNTAKSRFKDAVTAISATSDRERQTLVRGILIRHQLPRAHPLQCWREIKLFLGAKANTAGFSEAKKSFSSKVLTRMDAINELIRRDASDVISQVEQEPCESVRWVTPVAPHTRVNLSYKDANGERANVTFNASLPIVIEKGTWPDKVKYNTPKESSQERKSTAALKIIPLPFRDGAYLALG